MELDAGDVGGADSVSDINLAVSSNLLEVEFAGDNRWACNSALVNITGVTRQFLGFF